MARKSFQDRAQQTLADRPLPKSADHLPLPDDTRGSYPGTTRLRDARLVPLDKIRPDPTQPRKHFAEAALEELTVSVRTHGVLQPVTVTYQAEEDTYVLIAGERRYRAAQRAGLTTLPCIVHTPDPQTRLAHQLIENLQRQDLSPIEKARGLLALKETLGPTSSWTQVEALTGIQERRRQQFLALLDLPEPIQQEIVALGRRPSNHHITEKHARALRQLNHAPALQQDLFRQIKESPTPITGDRALRLAKTLLGPQPRRHQQVTFTYTTPEELITQLEATLAELKARVSSTRT